MTIIWCMIPGIWSVTAECFVILGQFLPFYPTKNLKNQNFEKMKKNTRRHYHFTHVYHKWKSYDVWSLRNGGWPIYIFVILGHFCPFAPLTTRKIKILKKLKKGLEISSFYTCVPKMMIIWFMVSEIWISLLFLVYSYLML